MEKIIIAFLLIIGSVRAFSQEECQNHNVNNSTIKICANVEKHTLEDVRIAYGEDYPIKGARFIEPTSENANIICTLFGFSRFRNLKTRKFGGQNEYGDFYGIKVELVNGKFSSEASPRPIQHLSRVSCW